MNYYDRHIGDYLKDTAHLSLLEHGVYTRLLDVYYSNEGPLDDDKVACRLVGAKSGAERAAVRAVLVEFFAQRDDGWHQARCDREIERYLDGEPEREVKKANEDNRLKRHREERARLFKILTDAGQHAAWNIPIADLRQLVERITATQPATGPATPAPPFPATAPATPATATQSHPPLPTTQKKEKSARKRADPPPERPDEVTEQTWGDWLQLRAKKRAPVTETVLTEAQREAKKAGLSLERFLAIWCSRGSQGLQADWLKPAERAQASDTGYGFETPASRAKRERFAEMTGGLASRKPTKPETPATPETEVVDVAARLVG